MYYGDGTAYDPNTTVTFTLSDQVYPSIEGHPGTPGAVFGGTTSGTNSPNAMEFYRLLNQIGSSTNAQYSTDGVIPGINVTNDYGITVMLFADALITSGGGNIIPTNSKNVLYAKLTLTFNRPVKNPVVHISGLGAAHGSLGLTAGLKLNDDYPVSKLAGNTFFQVSADDKRIYNSSARYGPTTGSSSPSGASGSIRITGSNINSLTFDVLMNGDGNGSSPWSTTSNTSGDAFMISTTLAVYNIAGTVYNDNNGGTPDGTVYEGAMVTLKDSEGNVVATSTTDADGNYSFADLLPGNYTVEITAPDGFEIVGASDGDTDGITAITIDNENITGIDFGINEPPVAADDLLTGSAPGSPATINILDNDSDPNSGILLAEDISLIPPDDATDILTDSEGDITGFTVPGEGFWLLNDDGTLTFTPEDGFIDDPSPVRYTIRDNAGLASDPAIVTIDYNDPVVISGTVHNDNDGGTPDGPGYEGVTVDLKDAEGNIIATATTGPDGNYSFNNVIPGNYTAVITAPDGFRIVGSSDGDTDGSTAIAVGSENISGVDFGINEPPVANDDLLSGAAPGSPATFSILENDSDPNDGILDPEGISLIAPAGATGILTDADGDVTGFTVPGEGTWILNDDGTLTFSPEDGFISDPEPVQYTVLDAAGLTSDPATGAIDYNAPVMVSGTVHNDNNGGTPDGTGYEGATVTLKDAEGNVVATTTTDADGNYSFANIIPGNYTVEITAPDGFEIVGSSQGNSSGSSAITVGNEDISGVDFGINEPPVANDDLLSGAVPGSPATINLLDNDSDPNNGTLYAEDIGLIAPGSATDILTDSEGDVVGFTIPGEGSWILNDDGTMTFTPGDGFTGDPTPVQYTVRDAAGLPGSPATATIMYDEPLPVDLVAFTVNMQGCLPILKWATATEKNLGWFEIERGENGRDFKKLTAVSAQGSESNYRYSDETAAEGIHYYRLKMTDKDESYSYSPVIKASVTCTNTALMIYPNPADDYITISGLNGDETIAITDMTGRYLKVIKPESLNPLIDIGNLAPGIYQIMITNEFNSLQAVKRLVKR